MTLNYDFDVYSEISRGIFANNAKARHVKNHAIRAQHKIALFRDPNTIKAFHTAPDNIRKIFFDAKFSSGRSFSKVPKGYYLESDHEFRTEVFNELEKQLASQLTEKELNSVLSPPSEPAKQKKYALYNRLKKQAKNKKGFSMNTAFNVGTFINAAYNAKSVAVPKAIAQRLNSPEGVTTTSSDKPAFIRALAPRLAFILYLFAYSSTQVNAAVLPALLGY